MSIHMAMDLSDRVYMYVHVRVWRSMPSKMSPPMSARASMRSCVDLFVVILALVLAIEAVESQARLQDQPAVRPDLI